MKKIKYLIVIVLLITLNGVLVYKFKSNSKVFTSINFLLNKSLNKNKEQLLTFEQNFINEKASGNLELNDNTELVDIDGNVILVKEIFKRNSVVLRYSEFNCKDCIEAEINVLIKNKLKEEIILIAFYQNRRDLFVFREEFKKRGLNSTKMFLLPDRGLNIPIEKLNMPFYFCIDSNLTMTNFFIPQKDKPKLTEVYLNYTFKNFLREKKEVSNKI